MRRLFVAVPVILGVAAGTARAGLTMELHFYRNANGSTYSFYTPLLTNDIGPAAPLGTYLITSPHQPANGSRRGFQLTSGGMQDLFFLDSEQLYNDFDSAIFQITNGTWTLQFTNASTTNIFHFTVGASSLMTSNMLPASIPLFPTDASIILTNQTNFIWQGPTNWSGTWFAQLFNSDGYYAQAYLSFGQTNWMVDSTLQTNQNYSWYLQELYTNNLFTVSTPIDSVSVQPFAGWDSYNVLESGFNLNFSVVASHGIPTTGHTLLANYTFEDNNVPVHDFAGGNDMNDAWFTVPPTITNDAAAGTYAGRLGGFGWFTGPDSLKPLFEKTFSVSLWLKTTNVVGNDDGDLYSAPGIISDLGSDYTQSAAPMIQTGHKLGFYTGGDNANMLHSQADIITGQYVHLVVTRDQQTGQKCIYVNGVLDSTVFSSTNVLESSSNGDLTVGYNNGQVFKGEVDEIQFYAGVLSSNDVAFLHAHPGTNVADVLQLDYPVARYDFEDPATRGLDTSGHNNSTYCSGFFTTDSTSSTDAIVGNYARQFSGDGWICFGPELPALSNALSGDFTVAAWIKTTASANSDSAAASGGSPVFYAYSEPTNGAIPISITGSKAAFSVFNADSTETTVHSITSVNDGRYHSIAVTRTLANGLMNLYVDGVLEGSAIGNKSPIYTDGTIYIGGGTGFGFSGLIDDVRIYAGTMTPRDVATLAANGAPTFASTLGTTNFVWSTSGDSPWFVEVTNTYNGAPSALQNGSISGFQTSSMSAKVTGPGTLSFVWQNPTTANLDLAFYIDGASAADIGGFTDWTPAGPFEIPAGRHTLTWTSFAGGDLEPHEAAFVGQLSFLPTYLAAHFDFENTNVLFPLDVSSNGNDMNFGLGFNNGGNAPSTNAAAGTNSLRFFRDTSNPTSGGMVGWKPATPPGLLQTLAGSFSVSLWIKTTNHTGSVGDTASDGTPIVIADIPGDARDVTPVALTGGAVAFGTGGTPGDDTLTSSHHVNNNAWHHIVVTRDQITGIKRIFIDGVEDVASPQFGVVGLLNEPKSISFGARLDASVADPSASPTYGGGYDGLLDDVQIYTRALSKPEVTFLYNHPGLEITPDTQGAVGYDVQVCFEFHANAGQYWLFPTITSLNPPPLSDARIVSPHGAFVGTISSSSSSVFSDVNSIVQECNGGNWELDIDPTNADARFMQFSMTVSNLDASKFPPVTVKTPADGSVNVSLNPNFTWSGPSTFQGLNVAVDTSLLQTYGNIFDDATPTNWISPTLSYGTNQFFVNYTNTLATIAIGTPTDISTGQSLSNWVAGAGVYTSAGSTFVIGAPFPLPVLLGGIHHDSASIQFSFGTLAGRPHILEGTTNLGTGQWIAITNFVGDGSDAQFTIPNTNGLGISAS